MSFTPTSIAVPTPARHSISDRDGFVGEDGRHLVCSRHGAVFTPETGLCVEGPCPGASLERLPVSRMGGRVIVVMPDMTPDDEAAEAEEANARFYRAFEALDLAEMDRVWAHGEHVRCVHPGWALLEGWEAVRQSWEAIFKGSGEMRFSLGDVQARVTGDTAWVTCAENILSELRGTSR